MSNTRLWDALGKTDPSQTKGFKRAGGFAGTAIKPMWSFKRMTEQFGPCGLGWGVNKPSFQVVSGSDGEVLVYCTVSVWYGEGTGDDERNSIMTPVFGVGGDKVVVKQQSGLRSDDEAFKKAYTDAIGNALKLIGVGADVHMGLFDDSKYVNEMRQEFSEEKPYSPKPSDPKGKTVAQLKKDYERLKNEMSLESAGGYQKLIRWINSDSVLKDIEGLERYAEDFKREFKEVAALAKKAEETFGEPAKITPGYIPPDFSNLPNDASVGDILDAMPQE